MTRLGPKYMPHRRGLLFFWRAWGLENCSPTQYAILHLLRGGREISIDRLFAMIEVASAKKMRVSRGIKYPQQRIGSIISRLNRKLVVLDLIIKPGEIRRATYVMRRRRPGE